MTQEIEGKTLSPAERHRARRVKARRQFIGALAFLLLAAAAAFALFDDAPPPASAIRISIPTAPPPPANDDLVSDVAQQSETAGEVLVSPKPANATDALAADAADALRTEAADTNPPSVSAASASAPFVVQVFAAARRVRAEEIAAELNAADFAAFVEELDRGGAAIYRVRIGGFATRAAAESAKRRISALGYAESFVEDLR
jgi:cell division septation protein DedD